MRARRPYMVMSIGALLVCTGCFVGATSAGHVDAGRVPTARQTQSLAEASFAAEAAHIGSLRGVNTHSLIQQFTHEARSRSRADTGQLSGGGIVNVNNWTLTPAGGQAPLGDLPVHAVLAPDDQHMLVVNSGAGIQSVQIINVADGGTVQTIPYVSPHSVFVGAAYSPDGTRAFVSGGGENTVHTFTVAADGTLTPSGDVTEAPAPSKYTALSKSSYPTGLSVSPDGRTVYVANNNADDVAVIDVASRTVKTVIPVGYTPYSTMVNSATGNVYVSNWGDGTVSVIDSRKLAVIATIPVGQHPSEMAMSPGGLLYVSDSNSDAVSVINPVSNTEVGHFSVTANLSLPPSSSPQGLSVSPDGSRLYVALAGNNAVAVFSLAGDPASPIFQGWIPTAWYPTDVIPAPDGTRLFVTNGFGMGEHANNGPLHPDPTRKTPSAPLVQGPGYCNCSLDQFSGTMDVGTLETVTVPNESQLRGYTIQTAGNDRFFDLSRSDRSANNPVPVSGGTSPIQHVIYIVKENRTYDQVFGDESAGKGDPSLTLFPKSVTPNLHALAERFGLLDNFYADAQVSADGHNWTLSANANDYTEKLWPQDYSTPNRNFGYPFESGTSLPLSPGGYLWDAAAEAGISYRDYGLYANFDNPSAAVVQPADQPCSGPVAHTYIGTTIPSSSVLCFPPTTVNAATTPNLVGHIDPRFINYDMRYPDVERVAEWQREFNQFVAGNNLPALELVRLSNDHTQGTRAGVWTPQRYASDNDAAVGQLVDAVSHSPYWSSTAIFVVEDDAQDGPDHIDSHRTEALVISPYTSQATPRAESTHYDTAAMVRTIELLLGLRPLSQYDATATPMWHLFGATADSAPYTAAAQAVTSGTQSDRAFGGKQSDRMNWALPDQAWAPALNRILWHDVKGARTPYPGADPYGIPVPHASHYVWGAFSGRSYPLLNVHGSTPLHIKYVNR